MGWAIPFKPARKEMLLWLGLFMGTSYIIYLLPSIIPILGVPPVFGYPYPFYDFRIGPQFYIHFFLIDAVVWYVVSNSISQKVIIKNRIKSA